MLKKKVIIPLVLIGGFIVAIMLYSMLARFSDYSKTETLRTESGGKTNYEKVFKGILSYNPDGASYFDSANNRRWNLSYEMQDPKVEYKSKYLIVYDRQGTLIEILNEEGEISKIITSYPVTMASLSEKGKVAVLMQQEDTAHIIIYDMMGNITAEGQLHGGESGFPMAISLSADSNILAVSNLHLSEADIKTEISFYDFSKNGEMSANNKASTLSYSNEIFPIIDHVSKDRILAIGSNRAIILSAGAEPKIIKDIFYDKEIKSVAYSDNYFGIVTEGETEDGAMVNVLDYYTTKGQRRFTKNIENSFNTFNILDNEEIFLSDGKNGFLITSLGVPKFSYSFVSGVQNMEFLTGMRDYYLQQNGELLKIRLK